MALDLNDKSKNRIGVIDCVKGLAIIMIIITHCNWPDGLGKQLLFPFWVNMAVPLFMIITGYLYTNSYSKRNKWYEKEWMIKTFLRYSIPFFIAFGLECVIYSVIKEAGVPEAQMFGLKNAIITLLEEGGYGPGAYYYCCMIQIMLFFSVIYWLIKNFREKGLFVCFFINLIYEISKTIWNMNPLLYRMLAFRYIYILAAGCYLFYMRSEARKLRPMQWVLGVLGAIYLFAEANYVGTWSPKIMTMWSSTCVIASMYIVPIFWLVLTKGSKLHNRFLEKVGRCSYDIFLVQMVYYNFGANVVVAKLVNNVFIMCLLHIAVCVSVGIIYNKVEEKIVNRIFALIPMNKMN